MIGHIGLSERKPEHFACVDDRKDQPTSPGPASCLCAQTQDNGESIIQRVANGNVVITRHHLMVGKL